MHADLWKKVEELYHAALAQPPEKRVAFLAQACPDPQVRGEVESLLEQNADSFLESAPLLAIKALGPGVNLGKFEIVELVGRGGMGEVYRARDTRLKRDVAIKVLPADLARDPDRIARFEREARAASALNHPNIVSVYDIGRDNDTYWIASELVSGESLARIIEHGPLPPRKAIQIAVQIADGLAAAHAAGIVHRDLKPANIMVTREGRVKILDFGLAKHCHAPADSTSSGLTEEGTVMGTPQYMAPEQLAGKEADARSDLFAFGAVLYEMATGRKAFEGNSQATLIAAILKDDPPPMATLQPLTPPALEHVAETCLAKDPEDRWQTALDVLLELKWIAEAGSQAGIQAPVISRRKGRPLLSWAIATTASLAFLALAVVHLREKPSQVQPVRFQIAPPGKVTLGWVGTPVIAPDGRHIVFSGMDLGGKDHLWLHSLDSLATQALPGTEYAYLAFWSPDSRFIGFFTRDGKLKKIDTTGGAPETLCEAEWPAYGGAWNPEGIILFSASFNYTGLLRISAAGGEAKPALELNKSRKEYLQHWPDFLPDGRHFLYLSISANANEGGIYVASLDSKETHRLISAGSNVRYAPPGFLVYARQETLLAQHFDAGRLRTIGAPFPIAEHVWGMPLAPGSVFSVSQNGVLAYRTSGSSDVQLAWYSRDGRRLESVGAPGIYGQMALSPDEQRLVVERPDGAKNVTNLWILELASSIFSRLTFSDETDPVWSPDGREVVFVSYRGNKRRLYRKVVGGGEETVLFEPDEILYPENWPGDGKSIIMINVGGRVFSQLPLSSERRPVLLLKSQFAKDEPHVSPDGRWIAYDSDESGQWEVYVAAFPGFTEKRQVSNNGGGQMLWRKDGKELFYLALDGKLMAVDVKAGATIETGVPKVLFQTPITVRPTDGQFCVTGDGRRFLFGEPVGEAGKAITVVLNWASGLEHYVLVNH